MAAHAHVCPLDIRGGTCVPLGEFKKPCIMKFL